MSLLAPTLVATYFFLYSLCSLNLLVFPHIGIFHEKRNFTQNWKKMNISISRLRVQSKWRKYLFIDLFIFTIFLFYYSLSKSGRKFSWKIYSYSLECCSLFWMTGLCYICYNSTKVRKYIITISDDFPLIWIIIIDSCIQQFVFV